MAGSYIDVQTATGSFKAYLSVPEAGQGRARFCAGNLWCK